LQALLVPLGKLAARVAPPSVKQHLAEQAADRERRERAYQDEQAARLQQQREKLATGGYVRCACCGGPIESEAEAVEKDRELVHAGDCEHDLGSEIDAEEAA
jgi:RNA polymerase-binding transcription factor DksA